MKAWIAALTVGAAVLCAGPGQAQSDLLFATPHLEGVAAGSTLRYRVAIVRDGAPVSTGEIALAVTAEDAEARRQVVAELERAGRVRALDPFRSVTANPIFLIFLEQVVRDIAQTTGGSPFYLRNRFKEGLAALEETTVEGGTRLAMQPLASDPNGAKLGALADLEVRFVLDPSVPGMFRSLAAQAGPEAAPIFLEEVSYEGME